MAHQLFTLPKQLNISSSFTLSAGAKAYFFETNSTTPQDTYQDADLSTPHAHPVVADAAGVLPPIYLDPTLVYKLTLNTAADVLIYSVDPANDQVLSQDTIGAFFYPTLPGETNVVDNSRPYGDVRRHGADALASATTNTTAIQSAIDFNSRVLIPDTYTIDTVLDLHSDLAIDLNGGGITLKNGVTTEYMVHADTCDNVQIFGGRVTGNGAAGFANILLEDCTNVVIDSVISTKAGAHGVQLERSSNCTVSNCDLSSNYFYGVSDRDGVGNRYICTRFSGNGATGVATSTGGRGINLWRCVGCYVGASRFIANNEYGYRIYSEAADSTSSYGNILEGCYFEDNAACDILHYDESLVGTLVLKNLVSDCVVQRATNPSLGTAVLIHGGDNHFRNVHVYKDGTIGNCPAFYFFHAVRVNVSGCSATNWQDMFAFSTVTDCIVDNCKGRIIATVGGASGVIGSGQIIRNCEFTHGGAGASDVALIDYNATGRNYYVNNLFDGFHTGIYIDTEAVTLRGNKTINSTFAGLRKDNNAQAGQELLGNIWESTSPSLIQYLERRVVGTAQLYSSAAPASLTWAVGDQCFNTAPAAAGTPGWVCTTAGTPGTWKARANVAA